MGWLSWNSKVRAPECEGKPSIRVGWTQPYQDPTRFPQPPPMAIWPAEESLIWLESCIPGGANWIAMDISLYEPDKISRVHNSGGWQTSRSFGTQRRGKAGVVCTSREKLHGRGTSTGKIVPPFPAHFLWHPWRYNDVHQVYDLACPADSEVYTGKQPWLTYIWLFMVVFIISKETQLKRKRKASEQHKITQETTGFVRKNNHMHHNMIH